MSDDNNTSKPNPLKTQQIKKTSAVPLRKETVRVTLKAPGAKPGAPIPPSAPTASLQPSKTPTVKLGEAGAQAPKTTPIPAPAPTIPLGGSVGAPKAPASMTPNTSQVEVKVDLPDVTSAVPLKQETMRVTLKADKGGAPGAPAPAPTIPLGNSAAPPRPAVAAPTVPLGAPAPTIPLGGTQPLQPNAASQPLPKATVQLQQTQQLTQGLGAPSQAATIQTVSDDDLENKRGSGAALPLSIVAFVLSLVVVYFCFNHASIWVDEHADGDTMRVFEGLREDR